MKNVNNVQYQTTLKDPLSFEGVGVHTAASARVEIYPLRAGAGLQFRTDGVTFPATAEYVIDTQRATVIGAQGKTISTIEHLMAALFGMGVDNALICVDGPEIPILDGSAKIFADAIAAAGTRTLSEPRHRYVPTAPLFFRDGEKTLVVLPASTLRIKFTVDYPAPVGALYFDGEITPEFFYREIAASRTFAFQHEVEALRRRGLALGGTLDNAIVFAPEGPLAPLRWPNEVVRHKVLDLIGDLALLGAQPQCEVISLKSGHKLNAVASKHLRRHVTADIDRAASVT